ncbi:MAG: HAD family hydrolase [Burkholderiaceae bacterium]|tara:strand:+ start:1201 stop:1869 length:669 start_codon:yes stop_codon:yes gene_type:complete
MNNTLALFDLDHTLIPTDSDLCWTEFLIEKGIVKKENTRVNENFFTQYNDGCLDINEFLSFQLKPLSVLPRSELNTLRDEFIKKYISPLIYPKSIEIVNRHLNRGDICAIVTATNEFITEPISKLFNIPTLIATRLETSPSGDFTGRASGIPSFREGKVTRVLQWLATKNLGVDSFKNSFFYSDSINDLPLLSRVTDPVAMNPDKKLYAHAISLGWKIEEIF